MMLSTFRDLSAFRRDPLAFLLERGNGSEPGLVALRIGPKPVFLVNGPELIKPILSAPEDTIGKGSYIKKLRPAFGDSSLLLDGEEHRRRRAVLHGQLARGAVTGQVPQMAAAIRQAAVSLAGGKCANVPGLTGPLTLQLISIALFGSRVLEAADESALIAAVKLIEDELEEDMFRLLPRSPRGWFRRSRHYGAAHQMLGQVVHRVRRRTSESSVLRSLEQLGLDEIEIRDEILTMLLAGHHTTASAAAWLLYHLASDRALAEAVAAEASTLSDGSGELRANDLTRASISLQAVRETLRLYPSAYWFSREIRKPTELAGQTLKRGAALIICPWQLHRDPRFWSDPAAFRADRTYASRAYVPFGAGPRACVGMGVAMLELQLIALEFCAAYELSLAKGGSLPAPTASVTLVPPKLELRLRLREDRRMAEVAA